MRIYYLTGYPPISDTGGGGLANTSLIGAGIDLGHDIRIYSREEDVPEEKPDLYWLSNMNGVFSLGFLYDIMGDTPFIIQDDGYQNLCPQPTREYRYCFIDDDPEDPEPWTRWQIYGHWNVDYFDDYEYGFCRENCRYTTMKYLAGSCLASVSVSPMHGLIWSRIFPDVTEKQVIVDPQIDTLSYRPTYPGEYDRKSGTYIYVGTIARGKGYLECVEYVERQGGILYSVGDIHHTIDKSQVVNWLGHIPQKDLPRLYSQMEFFIHLPLWQEPQGRCITEALLCGCNVIVNEKVGAMSYPWWDGYTKIDKYYINGTSHYYSRVRLSRDVKGLRARIEDAPRKFWADLNEYIEGVICD